MGLNFSGEFLRRNKSLRGSRAVSVKVKLICVTIIKLPHYFETMRAASDSP